MAINIDKKLLRKNIDFLEGMQGLPFLIGYKAYSGAIIEYDGTWLKVATTLTQQNPALEVRLALSHNWALSLTAEIYASPDDKEIYFLFYEPYKGQFNWYQGFDTVGSTYNCRSRNGGVETKTTLVGQDWKTPHKLNIYHYKDQHACNFNIDGSQVASHTTNISAQPFDLMCAEPSANVRTIYVKVPRGMFLD